MQLSFSSRVYGSNKPTLASGLSARTKAREAGGWRTARMDRQGVVMSLADKFENQMEPAFTRSFDPESARRQLRMSIMLVVAMGFAAFVLGFASPIDAQKPLKQTTANHDSGFSGRLVSIGDK
jgi:hypothetical protein